VEEVIRAPLYSVVGYTQGKLIYSKMEETVSLWALDLASGLKRRLAEDIYGVANVNPKSPLVFFTRDVGKGRELHRVYVTDVRDQVERVVPSIDPRRITGICFDGETVAISAVGEEAVELWTLKPDGSAEAVFKTSDLLFVTSIDRNRIAGSGILKGNPRSWELFVYELDEGEFRVYTPEEGSTNKSPKLRGNKILFATTAFGDERLLVYDLEGDVLEEPSFSHEDHEKFKFTEYSAFDWFGDGKIWFIGKHNGRTKAFVDGRLLPLPPGFTSRLAVVDEGKVYATWSSLRSPSKVYEVDLVEGRTEAILDSKLSDEVKSRLGKVEFIKYRSFDGLEVPAFVFESATAPKPGPTVVWVHGGPWSEVSDSWHRIIASLVACGYHVVAPNFRGSTGYGEDFRRMDIGDPGGGDLLDIVHSAKWAKEKELASKLAVMGYSYGGFATFLSTVKQPDVWDAGVAGAGITDWDEMYELGDAFFKRFVEVLFDGRRELWRDRSAFHFSEKLKATLCIIHPQNDTRTPLRPVLTYALRLLELGKTFELHVLPDAGHIINKPDDALKFLFPAVIFLKKYL